MDTAVAAGLLIEDAVRSELAFAHPLYRAAIYADLSPATRRRLHARAADLVAGRTRLTHLVAAALGPDEALAGELEASALASAAVGDLAASAWALEQAASLSPDAEDKERRLLDAAVVHLAAADTAAADRALASCQASSARRDALTGLLGVFSGSPNAESRLLAAWRGHDPGTEGEIGARVAHIAHQSGWSFLVAPSRLLPGGRPSGGRHRTRLGAASHGADGTGIRLGAAGRSDEGLAVLSFLPLSGTEAPMSGLDALIMRGMLKVYVDDLPGAIADLGVAAARLRSGLPSSYPGPCLSLPERRPLPAGRLGRSGHVRAAGDIVSPRRRSSPGPGPGACTCRSGLGIPRPVGWRPGSRQRRAGRR